MAQASLKLVFSGLGHYAQLGNVSLYFAVETVSDTVSQAGLELHSPIWF